MPAVNFYAHEQIEGCVLSGGRVVLAQKEQPELIESLVPISTMQIIPAGPIALLLGSRVD